jgi:hypothetical protein
MPINNATNPKINPTDPRASPFFLAGHPVIIAKRPKMKGMTPQDSTLVQNQFSIVRTPNTPKINDMIPIVVCFFVSSILFLSSKLRFHNNYFFKNV